MEDAVDDIAGVFHWPASEIYALSLGDLLDQRERAVAWWNRLNTPPKGKS
ncbi:MAG: GpE family phage tail protein [Brevundimonas sp.]|nr:MAG: GpE family phage tail protein [Brevundimonas sp.]